MTKKQREAVAVMVNQDVPCPGKYDNFKQFYDRSKHRAVSMGKKKVILIISPESISKDLKTMRFVNLLLLRQLRKTINQA